MSLSVAQLHLDRKLKRLLSVLCLFVLAALFSSYANAAPVEIENDLDGIEHRAAQTAQLPGSACGYLDSRSRAIPRAW